MGRLALQLPRACQRAGAPVSRQDASDAHGCARQRPVDVLQHACRACREEDVQALHRRAAAHPLGSSTARRRSPDPSRCCAISPVTRIVSPISNRRLIAADNTSIAFRWKDYRINGPGRWKTMRLRPHEFIRRFLMHVLPKGFHRIRHYGLFANANRAENIATARALLSISSRLLTRKSSRISRRTPYVCCLARAHAAPPA